MGRGRGSGSEGDNDQWERSASGSASEWESVCEGKSGSTLTTACSMGKQNEVVYACVMAGGNST